MTGIVVDKYKDALYMFADGRVTEDDFIFTDHDDKIIKVDENNLFTMCGESVIIDQCLDLFMDGKLDTDSVNRITGEGVVVWLNAENVKTIDVENKNISLNEKSKRDNEDTKLNVGNNGISTYKHQCLPMFFGSGKRSLSGAYFALECHKSPDEKTYISRMRKAYKAASTRVTSVGPLKQFETIRLTKDKTK